MNPFRCFVDLALQMRAEVLLRYATGDPHTQQEADAIEVRVVS